MHKPAATLGASFWFLRRDIESSGASSFWPGAPLVGPEVPADFQPDPTDRLAVPVLDFWLGRLLARFCRHLLQSWPPMHASQTFVQSALQQRPKMLRSTYSPFQDLLMLSVYCTTAYASERCPQCSGFIWRRTGGRKKCFNQPYDFFGLFACLSTIIVIILKKCYCSPC